MSQTPGFYESNNSLPMYLYDDMIWNDIAYVGSLDALKMTWEKLFYSKTDTDSQFTEDLDLLYNWHKLNTGRFSRESVLNSFNKEISKDPELFNPELYANLIKNFDKFIFPVLEKYPDVTFKVYFPPYSVFF